MTVSSSQEINITLPEQNVVTFNVTDGITGNPVSGAKVAFNGYSKGCARNVNYIPFAGAINPTCLSWPTGYSSTELGTNASGQLSLAVLDDSLLTDNNYSFLVTTPGADGTTMAVQVSPTQSMTVNVVTNPPVVISGTVYLSDGVTTVSGAPVKWVTDGEYTGINHDDATTSVTDSNGSYSLEVPPGASGKLLVVTSRSPNRSAPTSPQIPWGLQAGGGLVADESKTVNIRLPKQNLLTFKVTEYASDDPIANATIEFSGYSKQCTSAEYVPFEGATSPTCITWPGGYAHSEPVTNASGEAVVAVFDDSIMSDNNYTWVVSHPFDSARVARVSIAPTTSGVVNVGMPGTPSQPEQPEATALTEEVELSWTEPWNGGAYIDYYKVWVSLNADGPFNLVTAGSCAGNIDPELRSCVVSGLTAGVTYYFAVIAHNIVGYSDLSLAVASVPNAATKFQSKTPTPSISGLAEVGKTITAVPGTWDSGATVSYQWFANGAPISGQNTNKFLVLPANAGQVITVEVTSRKPNFEKASRTSIGSIATWPITVNLVNISGSPLPGEMLIAQTSPLLVNENITYEWLRDGLALDGTNQPFYEVTTADLGSDISVRIASLNISTLPTSALVSTLEVVGEKSLLSPSEPRELLTAAPQERRPRWFVQRNLKVFTSGATSITKAMKALIKNQVESNPTADKFICTGIRREGGSMAENIMVRKRAKAACDYAKSLNPELSIWYQSKVTKAPSYVGRVLLVAKGLER
jgi:hypothetical protein